MSQLDYCATGWSVVVGYANLKTSRSVNKELWPWQEPLAASRSFGVNGARRAARRTN